MHSNVTIKNVSWPHFSWATLFKYKNVHIMRRYHASKVQHHSRCVNLVPAYPHAAGDSVYIEA